MSSVLTLGVAVLCWMFACAVALKVRGKFFDFDRSATVPLRGLMIFFVMIAHLAGANVDPFGAFSHIMWQNAAVAVFFFMSGYGQMCALKSRAGYLDCLIRRTAKKLFVPIAILFVCVVIGTPVFFEAIDWPLVFQGCLRGEFIPIPHIWYVCVLFLLTVAFSLVARRCGGLYLILGVFVIVLCMGELFKGIFHWPRWWWLSLHAYPVGMIFYSCEKHIRETVAKKRWIYVFVGIAFFGVCILDGAFRFNVIEGIMRGMIGPIVAIGFYVLPIPPRCKLLSFLGGISLELYLCHGIVRQWMLRSAPDGWRTLFGLSSIVVAVFFAWLLHQLICRMDNWRRGYVHMA